MVSVKNISSFIGLVITLGCGLLLLLSVPSAVMATSSEIGVNVCYPPVSPSIASPADGSTTKQRSLLVTGNAPASTAVYISRNGRQAGFVTANSGGSYSISVSLEVGANMLQASTRNECGDSASSSLVTVTREQLPTPDQPSNPSPPAATPIIPTEGSAVPPPTTSQPLPTLPADEVAEEPAPIAVSQPVILEPADGVRTANPTILVKGQADPFTTVQVFLNDRLSAAVRSDEAGEFAVGIPLEKGENRLQLAVNSGAEEIKSPSVTIHYEPPQSTLPTQGSIIPPILIAGAFATTLFGGLLLGHHHGGKLFNTKHIPPKPRNAASH